MNIARTLFASTSGKTIITGFILSIFALLPLFGFSNNASAIAKASSLSITIQNNNQLIDLEPGEFGTSGNVNIGIKTDNYTGYSLLISSQTSTSIKNSNNDEIESIDSIISEQTFASEDAYYNKWGYKPSQYISTENNTNTTIANSDYLPAPSLTGDLLDITNAANTINNNYTLSFATKVDHSLPAGDYNYTYVLTAVANDIIFNITYDDNTDDDVTNMPSPNPQVVDIDGSTPESESYTTLSNSEPIRSDRKFAGWCDVTTTIDPDTNNDLCSGNLYGAGTDFPIDQTSAPNITLYAVWVDTLFPIVWNQMGACEFHGNTPSNITGSECEAYHDSMFIDTGISLYSQENFPKDYEVHFTIDHYLTSEQTGNDDQQTFFNDKVSSTATSSTIDSQKNAPGVIVRRSGSNIEFSSKIDNDQVRPNISATSITGASGGPADISVYRLNGKVYYSVNNAPLVFLQDITNFTQFFGLTAWFGGYPANSCTGDDGVVCDEAKRFIEATLSNMYIKLGQYSDDDIHTITFNANGGTPATTTHLIKDGNKLTTLPETPNYPDHILQGWFTLQNGGTEINTNTIPSTSTTYFAHWLSTVKLANITNSSITLQPAQTATINITNATELEPYSFESNNTGVVSVDANTGEITAIAPGATTITMTGTMSGETKTIDVIVSGTTFTISFDSQGGSTVADIEVGAGATINPLPTSTKTDYILDGWYTEANGAGTQLTTSTVFDQNTPRQYYANWRAIDYVCKAATSLHTETCNRSGSGCNNGANGYYANGATITYGSLIPSDATGPVAGNAFTCDINNDGDYDEENERFYYYTTIGSNAALVYYKNILNQNDNYTTGLSLLPNYGANGWTNPRLVTFDSGDYVGKVARFVSRDEAYSACNNNIYNLGQNGRCLYLLEKSNFANADLVDGIWLGSTNNARIHTVSRSITVNSGVNAARPAIEVPLEYISLNPPELDYRITFDPHNGNATFGVIIEIGEALGNNLPADPVYENHIFQGWFTEATGGTRVTSATEPTSSTTYHAQWLKTVALAEFTNDSIMMEAGNTTTINVTNASDLEPYTFSSNNTSVVTVDPTTGEVTSIADGATTITMTGTISGATKTIDVTVANLLPVTEAIISNNDLTLPEGSQITIMVTNAALLEPYTFSSEDTSIASVDANTGVITGISEGTTHIIMTGTKSSLTKTLDVDVTAMPATMYTVTFNTNGGSAVQSMQVEENTAIGSLPTSTRSNYKFFGWYTDDNTFYTEVTPETIVDADITYYAKWVEDTSSFPIVFSETNACVFGGSNVNISGDYCTQPKNKSYIDSLIPLYTAENYDKDYEIGFTIVEYNFGNINQMTIVSDKYENTAAKWPGLAIRRFNTTSSLEITNSMGGSKVTQQVAAATTKTIRFIRENGIIKYSINGGNMVTLQDLNDLTEQNFDHTVWFGASAKENKTPQREFVGTLTDMYVKLGAPTEYIIDFDANGGTVNEANRTITIGDRLGNLPTPTPPNSNYTFDGWYDESVTPAVAVSANTIPERNKTYVAHYTYTSSNIPVDFNIANNATRGYQTIINNWVQNPINITTFNEASPINDSTWGNTSELSETQFWSGLRNNFVTNECLVPSYGDASTTTVNTPAWTSGTNDCSKPDAYDTKINAPLNVYLYDSDNSTVGSQVAYAKADNGIIHNMIPGQTYYWEKSDDSSVYGYVNAISTNGRRFVDTGKIRNTRDLGGLPATYTDGGNTVTGTVEYGRLFRGERLWNASTSELTNLGINKEYDLSNGTELKDDTKLPQYKLDQVIHYEIAYTSGDENNPNSNYMMARNAVTDIMTDISDDKNIYFHCRVGADRTGTVAYLLEGLLGVPDEARYEEYSLTHLSGLYDRTRYYKQKSSNNKAKFVYMMGIVPTTQSIYDWYMAGSTDTTADAQLISRFRSAMITSATSTPNANSNSLSNTSYTSSHNQSDPQPDSTNENPNSPEDPLGVTTHNYSNTPTADNLANNIILGSLAAAASGAAVYAWKKDNSKE